MEMTDGVPGSPFPLRSFPPLQLVIKRIDTKGKIDMFQGMAIIDVSFRYYEKVMLCTWSNILDDIQTIILLHYDRH